MLATNRLGPGALGSLVRLGLLALVPVVALGVVLAHVLNADVQQRYLETARSSATLIAQVGIQPLLNRQQVTNGLSSSEMAQVNDKLQGAALSNEVDRIKVWNRAGTIVYSDNPALIGITLGNGAGVIFSSDTPPLLRKILQTYNALGNARADTSAASLTTGQSPENA